MKVAKTSYEITVEKQKIEITNPEKVLFPKSKITKKDLIEYYLNVADLMLPLIKDRPITMFRYPNGITQEHFVQKNASEYFPKWVKTKSVKREGKSSISMVVCNDKKTLVYLANQACITPHIWLSRKDSLHKPDRLIFDLDPPKGNFEIVVQGAFDLKELFEKEFHITPFVMTTGSKGVHVIVPIKRDLDYTKVRGFAKKIGEILVENNPDDYTINPRKEKRKNKLFIDYMRNAFAQTAVAPYAVRALEKAPVAAPIKWTELKKNLDISKFTIKTVFKREAVFKNIDKKAYSLKKLI
ncbi:MAG: non-homologous end-joining DNA ligase [Chlamydiota bacterium]|jgi:bifunctional non-homologous end joining protein LigD